MEHAPPPKIQAQKATSPARMLARKGGYQKATFAGSRFRIQALRRSISAIG